ncbi:MAG: hypothetical protein HY877_03400 [Deltaproteobacteria bacterium]|nr:hypothetical protein [Deltaproteobacteria bacterium]
MKPAGDQCTSVSSTCDIAKGWVVTSIPKPPPGACDDPVSIVCENNQWIYKNQFSKNTCGLCGGPVLINPPGSTCPASANDCMQVGLYKCTDDNKNTYCEAATSKVDGTFCDDHNLCTKADACNAGVCSGSPVVCSVQDGCHDIGICNTQTGVCSNPEKPTGVTCKKTISGCDVNGNMQCISSNLECLPFVYADTNNNGVPDQCDPPPPVCGNGKIETPETCDDGTLLNGKPNHCNLICNGPTPPSCGDNVLETGEACETDVAASFNSATEDCANCQRVAKAVCGNGTQEAEEQCDGSSADSNKKCVDCRLVDKTRCGDGIIQTPNDSGQNETCEPGVTALTENQKCVSCQIIATKIGKPPVCGNSVVDDGEACDNGSDNSDTVVGACKKDCLGIVPPEKTKAITVAPSSSEIFDLSKTCSISLPCGDVGSATLVSPNDYANQRLIFICNNNDSSALATIASKAMAPDCKFDVNSYPVTSEPLKFLATFPDALMAASDKDYFYFKNAEAWFQNVANEKTNFEPKTLFKDSARIKIYGIKQMSGTLAAVAEYLDHKLGIDLLTPDITAENGFKLTFVALPKELTDKTEISSVKIESADENNSSLRIFVTAKNENDKDAVTEIYECGQTGNAWNCLPLITSKEPVLLALNQDWQKHVRFEKPEEAPKALWIGTSGTIEELAEEASGAKGKKDAGKVHNDDAFNPLKDKAQAIDAWFQPKNAWTVVVGGEQTLKAYETNLDEKGQIQMTALPKEIYTADSTLNNFHNDDVWQCTHFSYLLSLSRKDFGGKDLAAFCKVVDAKDSKPLGTRLVVFYNINEKPEVKIEPQFDGKTGKVSIEASDIMEDKLNCATHLKDANGVILDHWIDASDCNEATLTNRGLPPVQDVTVNVAAKGLVVTGKEADAAKGVAWPVQGEVCAKDPGDASACQTFQLSKAAVIPPITPAAQTQEEGVTVAQGGEESTPQGYKISGGCSLNKNETGSLKEKLGKIFLALLSLSALIKMRAGKIRGL